MLLIKNANIKTMVGKDIKNGSILILQKTAQTTINRSADKQIMACNEMSLKK